MNKPLVLNERAAILLRQLVSSYILDGQPVGSKQLAQNAGLDISSATIRNVLSGLEKNGLIVAPHTSAGRIPTEQGLRLFVDSLLEVQPMEEGLIDQLQSKLDPDKDVDDLVNQASQLVSEMTHMAGVVSVPKQTGATLRHIEFLPLPDKRILAIMVTNERDVQNKVLHLDKEYSSDELQHVSNFLNQQFTGQDILQIREQLLSDLDRTRQDVDNIMKTAIEVADKVLLDDVPEKPDFIVQGETNLVRYNENTDREQLQHLFEIFDRKREMLGLFDRCVHEEGVKIFIGHEAGFEGFGDCSVITAPYSVEGKAVGVLGVIGPARMNYDRVIPVVDVTAKLLGEALKGTSID
ncbi:MAG TPA: heat-inducible transcription repressor HrcA [Gammaproteobacteria bacterium]|nr:heat-inducible transcription repressor HrcA [Gammaproteobacteria bacterium]